MEQIAEQITQELLQDLPDQAQFFTPDELLSNGIPYIVVETLRNQVAAAILSELSMPESEWLHGDAKVVQQAWQNFVKISRKHLRIPALKLSNMLAEAVEQCLELALKPRQFVAEIIFKTRDTIDVATAKDRVEVLQVNRQLGRALLRYMEKKEKDEISIDQARELIAKVDQKLVENYHPLNWAQVLQPVFDLAGPSVDSELFRIFFDDKGKTTYARKFDQLNKTLTETEFIETLSSADVLDLDEAEDDKPELFVPAEEETETESENEVTSEQLADDEQTGAAEKKEDDETESETGHEEIIADSPEEFEAPEEKDEKPVWIDEDERVVEEELSEEDDEENIENQEEEEQEENIVDLFSQIREDDLFEEDQDEQMLTVVDENDEDVDEDDNISLLSKFMFDESMEDDQQEVEEEPGSSVSSSDGEPSSIYDEMNLVKDNLTDVKKKSKIVEEPSGERDEEDEELSFKIENDEEYETEQEESVEIDHLVEGSDEEAENDQPMWRSFLERDDLETESGYEYDDDSEEELTNDFEESEDDGFIEEPIYDLTTDKQDPDKKIEKISGWLDDEKDRFVDEIFKGSEVAYEQALLEIMDYENWKSASMYLEKEVFSRNKVDVYDEAAVDFTDRLHSFFLENNSKQEDRE